MAMMGLAKGCTPAASERDRKENTCRCLEAEPGIIFTIGRTNHLEVTYAISASVHRPHQYAGHWPKTGSRQNGRKTQHDSNPGPQ